MTVKRFFAKKVMEDPNGVLVFSEEFDLLKAEYNELAEWIAMQPCEDPQPIEPNGCHCLSCCTPCGKCLPCKLRSENVLRYQKID